MRADTPVAITRPDRPAQREAFIGNDSATMMTEETFEEFEARMKGEEDKPGMLEPIEGVSLQVYASIAAQQLSVTGPAFVKLLAKHQLDEAKFGRVSEAWMARLSDQSDPMAWAALVTEYGKAFAGAGAAGSMSFDRYVEVMTAQSCWAAQGKDPSQLLKKVFNLTVVDWSNAAASWAQQMSTDVKLMTERFPVLQEKYTEKYMAGVDDPDADLDV